MAVVVIPVVVFIVQLGLRWYGDMCVGSMHVICVCFAHYNVYAQATIPHNSLFDTFSSCCGSAAMPHNQYYLQSLGSRVSVALITNDVHLTNSFDEQMPLSPYAACPSCSYTLSCKWYTTSSSPVLSCAYSFRIPNVHCRKHTI